MTALSAHLLADPQAREGLVEVTVPKCEQTHVRPSKAFGPQGERGPQARRTGRQRTEDASGRWVPVHGVSHRVREEPRPGGRAVRGLRMPWGVGPSVHGISQARILEWVSSSRGSSQTRGQTCISCIGRQVLYCCTISCVLFRDPTEDNSLRDILSVALRGCSKEERKEPGYVGVFAGK